MSLRRLLFAVLPAVCLVQPAWAAEPVTTAAKAEPAKAASVAPGLGDRIFSPEVVRNELELGLRGARLNGGVLDGESALVLEAGYGFTDRLYGAVVADFEAEPGHDLDAEAVAVEGVFEVGEIPGGIGFGLYGEYAAVRDHDDDLAIKALFEKQAGAFTSRLNLGLHHTLGDHEHTSYGYAAAAGWNVGPALNLGVQAFGEIGDDEGFGGAREHFVGPVAAVTLAGAGSPAQLGLEVGYLFSAGEARDYSDGQARVLLAFKRHFGSGHAGAPNHGPAGAHGAGHP